MATDDALIDRRPWARWVNVVLGVWLVISAFVWPDSVPSRINTTLVGVLIAATAVWAMSRSPMRLANSLLAVWLFSSTLVIEHLGPTPVLNHVIVAGLVFVASLVPGGAATDTQASPRIGEPRHAR